MHSFILPLSFIPGILPANSQWMAANLVCGFGTAPIKSVGHKWVLAGDLIIRRSAVTSNDTYWHSDYFHCPTWKRKMKSGKVSPRGTLVWDIWFWKLVFFIVSGYLRDILNQAKTTFTMTECGDSGDQNICCGSHCTGGEFQRFAGHALHQKQSSAQIPRGLWWSPQRSTTGTFPSLSV